MCPVLVVIADELIHEALQMPFIENDHNGRAGRVDGCQPSVPRHRSATDF
jgi:hypothetical protein